MTDEQRDMQKFAFFSLVIVLAMAAISILSFEIIKTVFGNALNMAF